jgi:hypothetical protein
VERIAATVQLALQSLQNQDQTVQNLGPVKMQTATISDLVRACLENELRYVYFRVKFGIWRVSKKNSLKWYHNAQIRM